MSGGPLGHSTSTAGHAASQLSGLDLTQLEADVQTFFERGLALSTTHTYQSAKHRYILFCEASNSQLIPLTEVVLCKFVVYLANQKLKHQTIKVYLSGLRHLQVAEGLRDPFLPGVFPRLEYVLKGIKHSPAAQSKDTRLPITPPVRRKLWSVWAPQAQDADVVMLWAACCLGFFGFMRAGEFTCPTASHFGSESMLSPEDVAVDQHQSPSLPCVKLKRSKTDPFSAGVAIFLGRTGNVLCPVAAVLAYLAVRPQAPSPLFVFKDGSYPTRERLVAHLRMGLRQAGLEAGRYSSHSFRIGAATTAAQAGVKGLFIKMLGRWESAAYQHYVRTPRDQLAAISSRLACMQ